MFGVFFFGALFGMIYRNHPAGLWFGVWDGVSRGMGFALALGLVGSLVGGFDDKAKAEKALPNEGLKLSRKRALATFFVTSLPTGLTVWLCWGEVTGAYRYFAVSYGMISGLASGLIVGLNRGGSAVIKHYALRLILWRNECMPLNFIKFLDQCAKLIFLKKVGGGYIFMHRMLLDYFAELPAQPPRAVQMNQQNIDDAVFADDERTRPSGMQDASEDAACAKSTYILWSNASWMRPIGCQ